MATKLKRTAVGALHARGLHTQRRTGDGCTTRCKPETGFTGYKRAAAAVVALAWAPLRLAYRLWLSNSLKWIKDQIADEETRDRNHARYMRTLLAEQYRLDGMLKVKCKTLHYSLSGWRREEEPTQ